VSDLRRNGCQVRVDHRNGPLDCTTDCTKNPHDSSPVLPLVRVLSIL
jgi:hypothetical protein